MEGYNITHLTIDEVTEIQLDSVTVVTGTDIASGDDKSVFSEWKISNGTFSFTHILSKKETAKWMFLFGYNARLPRKIKKQFKKEKQKNDTYRHQTAIGQ